MSSFLKLCLTGCFCLAIIGSPRTADHRLLEIRSVYIVPTDQREAVLQLREKLPTQSGWIIVNDSRMADALLGINLSPRVTGFWVYEDSPTGTSISELLGETAYTGDPITTDAEALQGGEQYGHVVLYDRKTAEMLYNHTTRLWGRSDQLASDFLKDVRKDLQQLRVEASKAPSVTDWGPEEDFDFSHYDSLGKLDGQAWNHMKESVKVGYVVGYLVAVQAVDEDVRSAFESADPSADLPPLATASRSERARWSKEKQALSQRAFESISNHKIQDSPQKILAELDRFYSAEGNRKISIPDAIRQLQTRRETSRLR